MEPWNAGGGSEDRGIRPETESTRPRRADDAVDPDRSDDAAGSTLVAFTADWSVACTRAVDRLRDHVRESDRELVIVDVERDPDLAYRFDVETLPTVVLFEAGRPIDRVTGDPSEWLRAGSER